MSNTDMLLALAGYELLVEAVEWAERVSEPPDWPSWLHEAHELIRRVEAK